MRVTEDRKMRIVITKDDVEFEGIRGGEFTYKFL
jgi:hypothetical protein